VPRAAAALPLIRQGKRLKYFFVAHRKRLPKKAIWDIENRGAQFFVRRDLADDDTFLHAPGEPISHFVRVADPLSTADALSRRYKKALNDAILFTTPTKDNADADNVEKRTRLYHLGKILRDSFLMRDGRMEDPLELREHLKGDGEHMLAFLRSYEEKLAKLD